MLAEGYRPLTKLSHCIHAHIYQSTIGKKYLPFYLLYIWYTACVYIKENINHKIHWCYELKQLKNAQTWNTFHYILTKLSENCLLAHINIINEMVFNAIKLNIVLYTLIILLYCWTIIDRYISFFNCTSTTEFFRAHPFMLPVWCFHSSLINWNIAWGSPFWHDILRTFWTKFHCMAMGACCTIGVLDSI